MGKKRETFADLLESLAVRPADVAEEAGLAVGTLYEYRKGSWAPKPWTAKAIADALGVPLGRVRDACRESVKMAGR